MISICCLIHIYELFNVWLDWNVPFRGIPGKISWWLVRTQHRMGFTFLIQTLPKVMEMYLIFFFLNDKFNSQSKRENERAGLKVQIFHTRLMIRLWRNDEK